MRRVQDIERWLNACNAYVQHDGVASGAECERPCGHDGPHDPDPPPALAEQLCHESRVLTDVTERAADRLGWLAPAIDQRRAALDPLEREHRDALDDVASTLDRIERDARRLANRVRECQSARRAHT